MNAWGKVHSRALALAGALTLALAGCSLLIPPPPAAVTSAVDRAVSALRLTDGVASVTSEIAPRDLKDGGPLSNPGAWLARITIKAEADVEDLRGLAVGVESGLAPAGGRIPTFATLIIPADKGGSEALLHLSDGDGAGPRATPDEIADAATTLRAIDGAETVSVSMAASPASVSVASASQWAAISPALRALPGFGRGALAAVTVVEPGMSRLTIDAISPSPALVPFLAELTARTDVASVSFEGAQAGGVNGGSPAWRPSLRVEASANDEVGPVAELLTRLDDGLTQADGVPRASFTVYTYADGPTLDRAGYIGLPLGSDEPDDRRTATPDPTPGPTPGPTTVPLDEAATAAKLEDDRLFVTMLLDTAGDMTGIRGTAEVTTGACDTGVGEQVYGFVVIPVFEIADSADAAFAAITSSWEHDGYTPSDRAMGTDFYSAGDSSARDLETLSIRGTQAGISIHATSVCNASG